MIGWIVTLIIVGIILFMIEIFLLPGLSVAAIGSFCSIIGAVALAFIYENDTTAWIVLAISVVIILILVAIFLRAATWKKISLETEIKKPLEKHNAKIGDTGSAMTRLAPMGKVLINGEVIEAKSTGAYIDEGTEVEVIGLDNMNIIVKTK